MIIDQPQSHFIFGYHPKVYEGRSYVTYKGMLLTNKEYLEYWGKWLVFGSRGMLDALAEKIDFHVESGIIACFKYDRKPLKNLGMEDCIMCVFCHKKNRDAVWEILAGESVKLKAWIYDRETIDMWLPGGKLLENWIRSENLSENKAERIRAESRMKFAAILDYPDRLFAGWPQ